MGNAATIAEFLRARRGQWYCDRCISDLTGIRPPNQVNQTTRPLSQTAEFERRLSVQCSQGGHLRTCSRARPSS